MLNMKHILERINIEAGTIRGENVVERHLSDVAGCFADTAAYEAACKEGNPVLYRVESVEPANGDGDMHYGIGTIMPGKISDEYYLTKGHFHTWRAAAEIYIGLSGDGVMLLEDESTGDSRMVELKKGSVVYVPGHTAHRTMNVGSEKLVYIGIYPAKAGHDYGTIATDNFKCKVIETSDGPQMVAR